MRRATRQEPEETEEAPDDEEVEPGVDFVDDDSEEAGADEYEELEGDEFYEDVKYDGVDYDDDDFFEEPGEVVPGESDSPEEAERPGVAREALDELTAKLTAVWATLLAQARGVELPGTSDLERRQIARVGLIVSACLLVGAGAFFIGRGSGDDAEAARQEGEVAGRQAGAIEGATEGYPAGFRKGRARGFRKAYVPAYRTYFKRAYEQAGLDAPPNRKIDVPQP